MTATGCRTTLRSAVVLPLSDRPDRSTPVACMLDRAKYTACPLRMRSDYILNNALASHRGTGRGKPVERLVF